MFDQLKTMGAIAGIMKNRDKLHEATRRVNRALDEAPAIGQGGGGAVRVTVGSELRVTRVELAPTLASALAAGGDGRTRAEALIAEGVNDALRQAQSRLREAIDREAKALGLDGLTDQLGGLLT